MGGFAEFLMHPGMLAAGALAVAIPIIIHLLNRRRFKIVEWAAMDFLFDAEKKNRRRVRIEHFLLLLLRCLAMLLIGLLLSRPFWPNQFAGKFFQTQQYERVVVLDDSYSMQARLGNRAVFDIAQEKLVELIKSLAVDDTDDTLTLIRTSDPQNPVLSSRPIRTEGLEQLIDELEELKVSAKGGNLYQSLKEVERYVGTERQDVNRVVYVFSDLLQRDWRAKDSSDKNLSPTLLLSQLAEKVASCLVVDFGLPNEMNVSIESIRSAEPLYFGTPNRFNVVIRNQGAKPVEDVSVKFSAGEAIPVEEIIPTLAAGETKELSFPYTYSMALTDLDEEDIATAIDENVESVPIQVEIAAVSNSGDPLPIDSRAYSAARVRRGKPVLLVDGDPSPDPNRSEAFFLKRALTPPGENLSGVLVDTISYSEFDSAELTKYRVVALCNLEELSGNRLDTLQTWVNDGGTLMIFPGDRVKAEVFNQQFWNEGKGLSPLSLVTIQGDLSEATWQSFEVPEEPHQVARVFAGQNNVFLSNVKLFSWWKTQVNTELDPTTNVIARINDGERSPGIVEKPYGKGRCFAFALAANRDWTDWPDDPSYVILMQDTVSYLCGNLVGEGDVRVGDAMRHIVDLTSVQREANMKTPSNERVPLQVVPLEEGDKSTTRSLWQFAFAANDQPGVYQLDLLNAAGKPRSLSFASNVVSDEGSLLRLNLDDPENKFGSKVNVIRGDQLANQTIEGGKRELWKWFLLILAGILLVEQYLGQLFGAKR